MHEGPYLAKQQNKLYFFLRLQLDCLNALISGEASLRAPTSKANEPGEIFSKFCGLDCEVIMFEADLFAGLLTFPT